MNKYQKFISVAMLVTILSFNIVGKTGEEKHYGKITTLMGVYEGEFNIKLNEENTGMISIKTADVKQKSKGKKTSYTESVSINAMMVRSFETEGTTYIVKNIAGENNKSYQNCCLKVVDTCAVASLAYWGTDTTSAKCFVTTKYNNAYQALKTIGYFTFTTVFAGCPSLKEKIKQLPESYREVYKNLSQEERLSLWKNYITEYNNCLK